MIRATLLYLFTGLFILVLAPPAIAWTLLARRDSLLYTLARACIRTGGWICGIRVRVEGKDKIPPGRTCVFLSNHQGNIDGPVLLHALPHNWAALVKKEMMRLPVLSLVLERAGFVPIERLNPKQAHAGIDEGARRLAAGKHFVAFPEGTRSRDGRLGPFKKGVFLMAIKAGAPVVPVTILGSSAVLPPGRYAVRPGEVRVILHGPIETGRLGLEDRDDLIAETRRAIASALPADG
ncbi:MAG: 1-acyl-sn-glycerol-3-phosphate acyltransferase [Acidobacteria bacterium]|nr:1-acyl-sn-glycerol-3-phosphate acyltransferase [Acidobacteriota bacterium]